MNKLKTDFKYIKQILLHKKYVLEECTACGIFWQGIKHDLSKFSKEELVPSAMYYDYDNVERTDEIAKNYAKAWCHHKGRNPHHWEYWIDISSEGNIITNKIPYKYVVEMVCDWIGAGKVYEKTKWDQSSPLAYYSAVRKGRHFHPETEGLILMFLHCIKNDRLDEFHKMAKAQYPYMFLDSDYENGKLL